VRRPAVLMLPSAFSGCRIVLNSAALSHNPEVVGSNPTPATKVRGPFSNRERASCMRFANGFANAASVHAATSVLLEPGFSSSALSVDTVEASNPLMISSARVFATWRSASRSV
jgi:hypothetical protein